MKELIEKFIIENNLDLSETGSALNSTCCIIAGYALHIGITRSSDIVSVFVETSSHDFDEELTRVFDYAQKNNYKKFWLTEEAKKQYKF